MTGVQTCALPIYNTHTQDHNTHIQKEDHKTHTHPHTLDLTPSATYEWKEIVSQKSLFKSMSNSNNRTKPASKHTTTEHRTRYEGRMRREQEGQENQGERENKRGLFY